MKIMNAGIARRRARLRRKMVGLKFVANGRVGEDVAKPPRMVVSSSSADAESKELRRGFARRGVRDEAIVQRCQSIFGFEERMV